MVEDENGDKMHTLHYKGFHVVLSEPLTPSEEVALKDFLAHIREERKKHPTMKG